MAEVLAPLRGLIHKDQAGAHPIDFVRARIEMQDEHMEEIWKIFQERVRAIVPLFETEVKGEAMLNRLVTQLFK